MKNERKHKKKQLLTKIIKTLDIHFMYKHICYNNKYVKENLKHKPQNHTKIII